jgi:hypothetical protein
MAIGTISPLSAAERQRGEPRQLQPRPMGRAWEYWTTRLQKAGELPPRNAPNPARSNTTKRRVASKPKQRAAKRRSR